MPRLQVFRSAAVGRFLLGMLLIAPLIAASVWLSTHNVTHPAAAGSGAIHERSRRVSVGGISRPGTDLATRHDRELSDNAAASPGEYNRYGRAPMVSPDANPAAASAYEALTSKGHPERLSVLLPPAPFNAHRYTEDPETYLQTFEPGRAWQTAQPGPNVPVLKSLAPPQQTMTQGESIRLSVRTLPHAPVTFASLDLGMFDNQLPSISVAADATGEAAATFTASSGTVNRVSIIASSPVAAEQARFQVWVRPPDSTAPAIRE